MGVQEELQFLRRKVNQLEDMMTDTNQTIKLLLNNLVKQRARHLAKRKAVLQEEEDDCLSLLNQLVSANQPDNDNHKHDQFGAANPARRMSRVGNQAAVNAKMSKLDQARANVDELQNAHRDLRFEELMFDDSNNLDLEEDESQWDNNLLKVEMDSDLEHELEPGMGTNNEDCALDDKAGYNQPANLRRARPEHQIRRKRRYRMTQTFSDEATARTLVASEGTWVINKTRQTTVGKKIFYQCKISKKCPVYMYLHEFAPGGEVDRYECEDQHVHVQKNRRRSNLTCLTTPPSMPMPSTSVSSSILTPPQLIRKP